MSSDKTAQGPDLTRGVSAESIRDGVMLPGRVGDDDVLLVGAGNDVFAVGAHCTHYHGPLAEGLLTGTTIRCPWHHACFDLRTGDALRAPALDPIPTWRVERRGDRLFVTEKVPSAARGRLTGAAFPDSVVVVGGGGAGLAAADMLRHEGFEGRVTIISADADAPVDRPNLSKDYLAGEAQEDWMPLRPQEYYADNQIELRLNSRVREIDTGARTVQLESGDVQSFGALILATGAEPVHLDIDGADSSHVYYLRTFADSRAIIAAASSGARAVVAGASFIGLEVAAALRTRGVHVDVVAPDRLPLLRTMGAELGQIVREIHEQHGVTFHLGERIASVQGRSVRLSGGTTLDADFVVAGVGVRPSTDLAARAGLRVDGGILVNEFLETSVPGIFAAGDAVRWLHAPTGERRHVEHWVVAERQGRVAARNVLGRRQPFDMAPFFWSQHYDMTIRYVGYADGWDTADVAGELASRNAAVSFKKQGRTVAVATIARDRDNLRAEVELER